MSSYTIGIDTIEKMVAKMEEYADWPIFKIKLGTADDLKIVRELRALRPCSGLMPTAPGRRQRPSSTPGS